jgi:hypothetical protein
MDHVVRVLAGAALIAAAAALPAWADNLVTNKSFEKPVVPDGTYQSFNTGDAFKGWKVIGAPGNVAIVNDDFTYCAHTFPAASGAQLVDLTGTTNTATGLQQAVTTTPGSTYTLTFFVGNVYDATGNCGTTSTVNVIIDGTPVVSFTNKDGKNSTALVWRKFSTDFVAKNAKTIIALINGDPPEDTANGLDAVSVRLAAAP